MSNSWWQWQEHEIEGLKDENLMLWQKVESLESENEILNRKVDWLYKKFKAAPPSSPPPPAPAPAPPPPPPPALALHGGYVQPRPLVQPQPPLPDPPLRMVHADPPTQAHEQALHVCVAKGWHTDRFNEWMVSSQENKGDEFQPRDPNSAISRYVQRLGTFSLPVAGKYEDSMDNLGEGNPKQGESRCNIHMC